MPTPYDNRIALWHWKGDSLGENSIEDVAQTIKRWAPAVSAVFVKTSDGSEVAVFMGFFDTTARMPYYATFDLAAGAALLGFLKLRRLTTNREPVHRPASALAL